jgi:hypothetical protein
MTSEEKSEKKRVEKRLLNALKLRELAAREAQDHCAQSDHGAYSHRWLIIDRRVRQIESTLRGYD